MARKYCVACGEQKPIRWPKDDPQVCSQRCAADHWMIQLEAGGDDAYCPDCGEFGIYECCGKEEDRDDHTP